jgi:hypothetical protein
VAAADASASEHRRDAFAVSERASWSTSRELPIERVRATPDLSRAPFWPVSTLNSLSLPLSRCREDSGRAPLSGALFHPPRGRPRLNSELLNSMPHRGDTWAIPIWAAPGRTSLASRPTCPPDSDVRRSGILRCGSPPPQLAVILPSLDEADTIPTCVRKRSQDPEGGVSGEVVVADNGSTDRSPVLAGAAGSGVCAAHERGYGASWLEGEALRHLPITCSVATLKVGSRRPTDCASAFTAVGNGRASSLRAGTVKSRTVELVRVSGPRVEGCLREGR